MRRFAFPLLAALGLACAFSGVWLGGLRNEVEIARASERLPRLDDTPFFRCADSFYWISYARTMIDTGNLRVRFTPMDNAPLGRPNYAWASLNAWYLVVLGKVWSVATGIPLRKALLPAAMWSGPMLYAFALVTILAIGRLLRNFPAAAIAVLFLEPPRESTTTSPTPFRGTMAGMIWLVSRRWSPWRRRFGRRNRADGSRPRVWPRQLQSGSAQPSRRLAWPRRDSELSLT